MRSVIAQFMFTVYDSAAGGFLEPFFAPSVEFAIREFRQAVNTEGHQFNRFPEDYTLFSIGEFDQKSGKVSSSEPSSLGVAVTFLERKAQQIELLNGEEDG